MFDDLVVSSANPKKTNKPWTVVLSAMIQAGLLGILILIPLIYTEALPKQMLTTFLVPPPPPPPPPPPVATPEPSSVLMLTASLACIWLLRRKSRA